MSVLEKQHQLVDRLSSIQDPQERFAFIVSNGRKQPALPENFKTEQNRIHGCLSKLWLICEFRQGQCFFQADADSLIVKSIASLLCELYSNAAPEEILRSDPRFLADVGITQHLSANRRNALTRVWETIRAFAQNQSSPKSPASDP